ncbi:IS66 family transposase [Roseateles saccharophilus]
MALLAPGKGKTKKAYVWVYRTTNFVSQRAVYYDFCKDRSGENVRRVLQDFKGTTVTDDFSGYHALHRGGVTAALCWAHARRKLFEAHRDTGSEIAGQAVVLIGELYQLEREARGLAPPERQRKRQQSSKPVVEALHAWLVAKRQGLVKADATAKAIDYALSNWKTLIRFLDDGNVPIDTAENSIRPLAVGRRNWLFVGSQQAGERAGNILSLIESAKLNGHDPWAYLKDVFERLPTLKDRDLAQLLPHNWKPPTASASPETPASVPATAIAQAA